MDQFGAFSFDGLVMTEAMFKIERGQDSADWSLIQVEIHSGEAKMPASSGVDFLPKCHIVLGQNDWRDKLKGFPQSRRESTKSGCL